MACACLRSRKGRLTMLIFIVGLVFMSLLLRMLSAREGAVEIIYPVHQESSRRGDCTPSLPLSLSLSSPHFPSPSLPLNLQMFWTWPFCLLCQWHMKEAVHRLFVLCQVHYVWWAVDSTCILLRPLVYTHACCSKYYNS